MDEKELEEFKKKIEADVRTCYGAISSFQVQLHHLCGIIEETHSFTEEAMCDIASIDKELKTISEKCNIFKEGMKNDNI